MKTFLDEHFLLQSQLAAELFHNYAKDLPIIDYHNHLDPAQVANNTNFENLTQAWLYGDHYKWRAMRSNGIAEEFITGGANDTQKFNKWAETVPYTLRNPLYHWTHLELQRYFDINTLLSPASASEIYTACSGMLRTSDFGVKSLLQKQAVEVICTTDDPLDNLAAHQQLALENNAFHMYPSFRADKALATEDLTALNAYIDALGLVSQLSIRSFEDYLGALKGRHDYFAQHGCRLADHGLEQLYATDYTDSELAAIFLKIRQNNALTTLETHKFKSAMLLNLAQWNYEKGWTQQYHLGAMRNNNSRRLKELGVDTGWDSIGDFQQGQALSKFLNQLDRHNQLSKTIIYNLNPADNALFASMVGNFNDGSRAGKVQYGAAWWFLDQKEGIAQQINCLSSMGLLSRFVGMLTDSRSFLSFPRHEYFRRILCNIFAEDIRQGELPHDIPWIGKVIQDICYYNAKEYFGFETK